jgi:hypothetical protein
VDALDSTTLYVLRELAGTDGVPRVSEIVTRAIAENGYDSSSLRLLGRDLRDL